MSSMNKLLYYLKQFLGLTSIMFSVTILIYTFFHKSFGENSILITGIFESLGLAVTFAILLLVLGYLNNRYAILNTKTFAFIQYIILLVVIILWSIYFEWGDWKNFSYVFYFISIFTLVYFIIFFLLTVKLKKEEALLNKHLKKYQNHLH